MDVRTQIYEGAFLGSVREAEAGRWKKTRIRPKWKVPSACTHQQLWSSSTWSKVLKYWLPCHWMQANNAEMNLLVIIASLCLKRGVQALSAHRSWMDVPVN